MRKILLLYLIFMLGIYIAQTDSLSGVVTSNDARMRLTHAFVNDIKKDFAISFLNETAHPMYFINNSHKEQLIQRFKSFINESELSKILDTPSVPFRWDPHQLTGTTLTSFDSTLKTAYRSGRPETHYFLSVPLFDQRGEFAIVRISYRSAQEFFEVGQCVHLFRRTKAKWTEIAKTNCESNSQERDCIPR